MDTLLSRYFDGELDDHEARKLLDAVESNPLLERELRAYERVLALGKSLPVPAAPEGFTRRVMDEVVAGGRRGRSRWGFVLPTLRPVPLAFAAASVVVAFIGGWWIARSVNPTMQTVREPGPPVGASADVVPVTAGQLPAAESGFRYVRLAYIPSDTTVRNVQVAGNFNGWDPNATPMRRQDGVWSTVLVLPPGSYEYMFVIDDQRWVTDPLAVETRDDGFGGKNAVLDVDL